MFAYTSLLSEVRSRRPLVHNITNYVVMNLTANALLAVGASPVMAHAAEEIEEMVSLADALVINIGTLSQPWIASMQTATRSAKNRHIPMILDPVGAGATQLRTQTATKLIEIGAPCIIRGNASEICALAAEAVKTRGVDSTLTSEQAIEAARAIAQQHHSTVVISGKVDHILTAQAHVEVHNGHALMSQVTGMGCAATALMGAFAATTTDPLRAAVATMIVMGVAGEQAAGRSHGPGSFVPHFLDALAALSDQTLADRAQIVTR